MSGEKDDRQKIRDGLRGWLTALSCLSGEWTKSS